MEATELQALDDWLADHLDDLVSQYAGQVVAIHNGQVITVAESEVEVYRRLREAGLEQPPLALVFRVPDEHEFQSIL